MDYQQIIDRYYPGGTRLRDIYMRHCRSVADMALDIARRKAPTLNPDDVEAAAMLHDIGIFLTDAPSIDCHGTEPYILHGPLGCRLLSDNGVDKRIALVARRHTGAGISEDEIRAQNLPLPLDGESYMPESQLERLVCYADKFYSKSGSMQRKPFDKVVASMQRLSDATLERFMRLHEEFGED